MENGKFKLPSIVLINKICQKLNLTLDEFLMFAFGGFVDHLWIRKNEIDSLIKKEEYDKALELVKYCYVPFNHPGDKQYVMFVEALSLMDKDKYFEAKLELEEALSITVKNINEYVFTMNEMRIINSIILCDWHLKGKIDSVGTDYINLLMNSIWHFPEGKEYNKIISLYLNVIVYYYECGHKDKIGDMYQSVMNICEKYSCYDYLGKLWTIKANICYLEEDFDKAEQFVQKAITFYELLGEKINLEKSIELLQVINHNKSLVS